MANDPNDATAKKNMELMQTLDDAWNAQDVEVFRARHKPDVIVRWPGKTEPTVGIVTNAGAAHLEGFGSLAGVAQGKGEMFRALPPEGVAVINADDTFAAQWRDASAAERLLTFGFEQPADFMAHKVKSQSDASGFRTDFELVTPYGSKTATLALGGLHNLRNALGAAAAACAVGVELDDLHSVLALEHALHEALAGPLGE